MLSLPLSLERPVFHSGEAGPSSHSMAEALHVHGFLAGINAFLWVPQPQAPTTPLRDSYSPVPCAVKGSSRPSLSGPAWHSSSTEKTALPEQTTTVSLTAGLPLELLLVRV